MEHIMKKLFLALLAIASVSLTAQAQSDSVAIHWQPDNSPILVGGAAPVYVEPVVNQQVIYSPPLQYMAPGPSAGPVQYSAPVQYNAPVQVLCPRRREPAGVLPRRPLPAHAGVLLSGALRWLLLLLDRSGHCLWRRPGPPTRLQLRRPALNHPSHSSHSSHTSHCSQPGNRFAARRWQLISNPAISKPAMLPAHSTPGRRSPAAGGERRRQESPATGPGNRPS